VLCTARDDHEEVARQNVITSLCGCGASTATEWMVATF